MSENIKVTGGLNIEWGQIDHKVTGGLNIEWGHIDPKVTGGLSRFIQEVVQTQNAKCLTLAHTQTFFTCHILRYLIH